MGVQTLSPETAEVTLDFDATDGIIHGLQEGRFSHGYYRNYRYLPLYGFVGSIPVWAQLRSSGIDASNGTAAALEKIVPAIRRRCPQAHRLFSFISSNWRGEPMRDYEAIVKLIARTTTAKGLKATCRLDRRKYPVGRRITLAEMQIVNVTRSKFHGDWNYVIRP